MELLSLLYPFLLALLNRWRGQPKFIFKGQINFPAIPMKGTNNDGLKYIGLKWWKWDLLTYLFMALPLWYILNNWLAVPLGYIFFYGLLHKGWGIFFPTGEMHYNDQRFKKWSYKPFIWLANKATKTMWTKYWDGINPDNDWPYGAVMANRPVLTWQTWAMTFRLGILGTLAACPLIWILGVKVLPIILATWLGGLCYRLAYEIWGKGYVIAMGEKIFGLVLGMGIVIASAILY